jgi:hypothetical protein
VELSSSYPSNDLLDNSYGSTVSPKSLCVENIISQFNLEVKALGGN